MLLHPTETVRRRLLATASLIIYLTTTSPAADRDSQTDPEHLPYKHAAPVLLIYSFRLIPLHLYLPLCIVVLSAHTLLPPSCTSHTPQSWYVLVAMTLPIGTSGPVLLTAVTGAINNYLQCRECKFPSICSRALAEALANAPFCSLRSTSTCPRRARSWPSMSG